MLIACILSLRTQDTTTGPAAARLFAVAATPAEMLTLPASRIAKLIYPVGFYRTKARVILGICRDLLERFGGKVPDTIDELLTLKGVGRKTANLVVTMGFNKAGICVDTHVHRISNRLGYVRTKNPEATWTFYEYFMSEEPAVNRANGGWGVPARKSWFEKLPHDKPHEKRSYTTLQQEMKIMPTLNFNPYLGEDAVNQIWSAAIEKALGISPRTVRPL